MAVTTNLLSQTIVLVTENINPSMFNMLWFVNNNIYTAEEILEDSIFVPGFTSLSATDSQVTIVPNQIQIAIKCDGINESHNCVTKHILRLVEVVESLPIKAIGINFVWKVADEERNMGDMSRQMFGIGNLPIYQYFTNKDSRLGAYFSQNIDEVTRLKLDLKPVHANENGNLMEFLLASFNYHSDMPEDNLYNAINEQLSKWLDLRNNSTEVVCLLK